MVIWAQLLPQLVDVIELPFANRGDHSSSRDRVGSPQRKNSSTDRRLARFRVPSPMNLPLSVGE